MIENAYPLDVAAEMLECQPKKIMTEWAKGTIRIVLDFGRKPLVPHNPNLSFIKKLGCRRDNAYISAPATLKYFPSMLLHKYKPDIFKDEQDFYGRAYINGWPVFYHSFHHAGFYSFGGEVAQLESDTGELQLGPIILCGYWVLTYSEFQRAMIQDTFHLTLPEDVAVSVVFTLGNGQNRINDPSSMGNLRITSTDINIMRKLLAGRSIKPPVQSPHPTNNPRNETTLSEQVSVLTTQVADLKGQLRQIETQAVQIADLTKQLQQSQAENARSEAQATELAEQLRQTKAHNSDLASKQQQNEDEIRPLKASAAEIPSYLNPGHPHYAPKLAASIHAWLAYEPKPRKTTKQVLTEWLRKHAEEFPNKKGKPLSGVEDLAAVANWDTCGGAPKTPQK